MLSNDRGHSRQHTTRWTLGHRGPRRQLADAAKHANGDAGSDLGSGITALELHGTRVNHLLGQVERRLRDQTRSHDAFVERSAHYLIDAGGKRLRPLLVMLAGHVGPLQDDHLLTDAGAVVELVHLATLHHDDVIDEARVRRGTASVNTRWNNNIAVLTGDFLFARASALAAGLGVEVTLIMAEAIAALCEGQMLEAQGTPGMLPTEMIPVDADRAHHLAVVDGKTASLIAASCRLGALLSQCDRHVIEQLTAYGRFLGTAFQLADDILDITSEQGQSGKTPGTDLREGIRTLPMLLALEEAPEGELSALLARDTLDEAGVSRALSLLRDSAALERARAIALGYAGAAAACIGSLPEGRVHRALRAVSGFAAARVG